MKRLITTVIVLALAFGLPVLAGEQKAGDNATTTMKAKGMITSWDDETKTFMIEDKDGNEWTFHWNAKTMVQGKAMVGEPARVEYTKESDGKSLASHVFVEAATKEAGKKQ